MSYYSESKDELPPLGALTLDYTDDIHRPPGDVIMSISYDFPVIQQQVTNATLVNVVKSEQFDDDYINCYVEACNKLEDKGCIGIVTSCGFLAQIQDKLASRINIPIATSSLLQIPYVLATTSSKNMIGVLTFDSKTLNKNHFNGVGVTDEMMKRIVVVGCKPNNPLQRIIKFGDPYIAKDLEEELVQMAVELVKENPNVKAIVLECTNMPPYSKAIQEKVGLPVYDGITMVNWFYSGLKCKTLPKDENFEDGYRKRVRSNKELSYNT